MWLPGTRLSIPARPTRSRTQAPSKSRSETSCPCHRSQPAGEGWKKHTGSGKRWAQPLCSRLQLEEGEALSLKEAWSFRCEMRLDRRDAEWRNMGGYQLRELLMPPPGQESAPRHQAGQGEKMAFGLHLLSGCDGCKSSLIPGSTALERLWEISDVLEPHGRQQARFPVPCVPLSPASFRRFPPPSSRWTRGRGGSATPHTCTAMG